MNWRRVLAPSGVIAAVALLLGLTVVTSSPASAAGNITAQGIALASSASCLYGDVDVTYTANGVTDSAVSFTAEDGAVLDGYAGPAYQSDFSGTEHVLTEADAPAVTGTVLGVYVRIGAGAPPAAATTAEFFVLYRCDPDGDADGGANEVLETCFGDYGNCPQTAQEALTPTSTTPTTATPTTPTDPTLDEGPDSPDADGVYVPRYTG